MPIIGLTDRLGSGLERIAKLYKGDEKPEAGNRPGKDLEYFRIEFEPQYEHLRELWVELYGERPMEFEPVFVTAATTDEAFQSWKEEYNATTLLHRCDGENQVLWYNKDAAMMSSAKIKCATTNEAAHVCNCKPSGRIDLMFPEFCALAGVLGVITLTTHSVFDIITLHSRLTMLQRINGSLIGVPLVFGRSKREVSAPKMEKGKRTGERMKVTKSLLYVHSTSEFTQKRLIPALAGALQSEQPLALQATGTEGAGLPELDTDRIKSLLGTGDAPRRMGMEPELAIVPPASMTDLDAFLSTAPEPEPKKSWTPKEAITWVNAQMANGHSDVMLRQVLCINSKWSEWDGDTEDASAALDKFIAAQIEATKGGDQ